MSNSSKPNGPTSSRGASNWARTDGKIMKGMEGVAGAAEQTARRSHAGAQGDWHHCGLRRDRQERRQHTTAGNFRPMQNDTSLKGVCTIRFLASVHVGRLSCRRHLLYRDSGSRQCCDGETLRRYDWVKDCAAPSLRCNSSALYPIFPMARAKSTPAAAQSSAIIGFEAKLWLADDNLRNNMDAAEFHTLATLRDTLLPKL